MDYTTFKQLLSAAGQDVLQSAIELSPTESDFLIHFQSLSRHNPPDLARAALETAILRREARNKFPFAHQLYLTRQAMEQASSFEISSHRAERFRSFSAIADLGCSIGADTFALVKIAPTVGMERDPLRLAMASANLNILGCYDHAILINGDITHSLPIKSRSAALFFDPSRRLGHKRSFSVENYQPPLSTLRNWLVGFPAIGVKISPGVNLSELTAYDAEIEFVSLHGELKEAVLWFGPLKTASRVATILPGPHQITTILPYNNGLTSIKITEPKSYLLEPDPAVIRAGLVTDLAEMLQASQLDRDIAYLTSDTFTTTPFARRWAVVDWFHFHLKRLREYLRQHDVGHVIVKKRGSPLDPEVLIHQLHLDGKEECVLVLTHLDGEPIVIICNEL